MSREDRMKKLVRDYDGERDGLQKLEGAEYRKALFETMHYYLAQMAIAEDKGMMYDSIAECQEVWSTLVSTVMPKNPASYEALHQLGRDKGVDGGGFFEGYYEEFSH